MPSETAAGYTVPELAKRFRVGEDKVRNWIRRGELSAINTAERRCARPRFAVTPEALAAFERRRATAVPDPPKPKRRKKICEIDFYPD